MLDKAVARVYIVQARLREPKLPKPGRKKLEKKEKVFLDTGEKLWYIRQAVTPKRATPRCTLKIEQCKKKLMQISTKKRAFKSLKRL